MRSYDKVIETVSKMTVQEKIDLCEGVGFWSTRAFPKYDITSVMMCDGPHGLRKQGSASDNFGIHNSEPATCFPTSAATACSWDTELLSQIGRAIGEEARANGVALTLGPGLNIKRNPLCGRNFEYFSEDPYLSGKLGAAYINGEQSTGVGSCIKHFFGNSQEYKRFSSNSIIEDRAMHEIYLLPFEMAIKEGPPAAVMTSYNKVNGHHIADNRRYIFDLLRADWCFPGMVITDWGAMNDRAAAFRAGCDLMMPGGSRYQNDRVLEKMRDTTADLNEMDITWCARRVLQFVEDARRIKWQPCDMRAHHELARMAAEQSAVLMKNEGALPIKGSACMIGHMAKELRYQGVGSSHINPSELVNPVDCIDWPFAEGCMADGSTSEALIAEAAALAKRVDIPVVFAGLTDAYESEGIDRENMRMPEGHNRMIEAVAEANPKTVVVLMSGSAVEIPWADKVNAILYMGLPGQAGGQAIKNLLTGKVSPSGRLAETWPISYDDVVSKDYYGQRDAEYREGIFVGYRYYDRAKVPVRYKFGHGLSYTSFEYSDIKAELNRASVTVKNVGDIAGAEVVQLWVIPPEGELARPVRELKGFKKVFLRPGESARVEFTLSNRSYGAWKWRGWLIPKGLYTVSIGGLEATVDPHNCCESYRVPEWQKGHWYETMSGTPTHEDFERMMDIEISPSEPKKGEFTLDSSVIDMMPYSKLMRTIYRIIEGVMMVSCRTADRNSPELKMMMTGAADSAVRNLSICGGLNYHVVERLVDIANGKKLFRLPERK